MFKAIGTLINKTPWWAMVLAGISTLLFLVVFTIPFQLIHLSESGATVEQRRAIKKEIDSAFGDSALGVVEGIVSNMRERTYDPVRKGELDRAMEEIARARQKVFKARSDVANIAGETSETARDSIREAAAAALESAKDAAEAVLDGAREGRETIEEARRDVEASLKSAGVASPGTLKALDEQVVAAKAKEAAAKKALDLLKKSVLASEVTVDAGADGAQGKKKDKAASREAAKPKIGRASCRERV